LSNWNELCLDPVHKLQTVLTAYLLIGGNLGDRAQNLQRAAELVESGCGDIIAVSAVYETAAWGFSEQPAFLNQVLVLHTLIPPLELMEKLLSIELEMGRVRGEKLGPRIIDIDILLIDGMVMETDTLTIPHPSLHLRRFALEPLAEVAAHVNHPVFQKTIAELLTDCPDTLGVTKIS
jgi:2-amino-4-hydroxy-6-hydroxymethyldihydropteridine diphosphokinase